MAIVSVEVLLLLAAALDDEPADELVVLAADGLVLAPPQPATASRTPTVNTASGARLFTRIATPPILAQDA
jgi:hypothetical protein